MRIESELALPMPPEEAWRVLLDIPFMAPCIPGAELTDMPDERTCVGRIRVRFGPVRLSYSGSAILETVDPDGMRVDMSVFGRRGREHGEARARLTFLLSPSGEGTRVAIGADVAVGDSVARRVAAVVRGMTGEILQQFSARLCQRMADGRMPDPAPLRLAGPVFRSLAIRGTS